MKQQHILLPAVSLGLALCMAGCGAAPAGGASTPETAPAETSAAPTYTGPLYELTFENLNEKLPELQNISTGDRLLYRGYYKGMKLWPNFRQNDTLEISSEFQESPEGGMTFSRKFCDTDFRLLPIEGPRKLLCGYDGYRVFAREDSADLFHDVIEVYDPDCNLIFTTENTYQYIDSDINLMPVFLQTGWLPVREIATSCQGFVNVYTQEWHPLESTDYVLQGAGMFGSMLGALSNSFYSDGLAYVVRDEAARVYNPGTSAQHYDKEIVGFVDETGNYAFRFDQLPDFDGLLVTAVTGYLDGSCIVAGRIDDGVTTGSTQEDQIEGVDIDFFYRIDTAGHILEEVDYDTFDEFRDTVFRGLGVYDVVRGNYDVYQADRLQVADGLELRVKNPLTADSVRNAFDLGGYELVDANGTVYSLDDYDVVGVLVGDDGTILLKCDSDYRHSVGLEENGQASPTTVWYQVRYDWIAPEGYVVPEDQRQNLSADGLPTSTEYQNQQQLITVSLYSIHDMNDLVFHFSGTDFTSDYVVKEEDYDYLNASTDDPIQELTAQFATLSEDTITITCDWTDDAGAAHHGSYDPGTSQITEDAA